MVTWLHRQLVYLAAATMYLTRLRMPRRLTDVNPSLNLLAPYFPLVGMVVGAIAAIVYRATAVVLPIDVAVMLSMAATIYATGAFHEDGFADVCDGFGGGWSKDKILMIMKDSRIGAFGAVGMVIILGLKYQALSHVSDHEMVWTLVTAHALSRAMPVAMSHFLINAREDAARVDLKPSFHNQTFGQMLLALAFGLLPVAASGRWQFLLPLPLMGLMTWHMGRFFKRWIGGYTGDCCGAVQQVTEVVFYLTILATANL
ncbi:MAG: adenosylcobinamide-GDP ribazoletransferase [Deltaproteobacteria bacterium]|nr:adenosylcobinamide-GDP ribazoletransferase [Deltaproteobacteria bacterium]